jgi:lactate dehydrogenase-like 2-hydroxyacid dehydrogenase
VITPTKALEASSINLRRSAIYGMGVIGVSIQYFLQKVGMGKFRIFEK